MTTKSNIDPDFKLLFESSPRLHMVVLPNKDFTVIAASDAFLRAIQRTRENFIGKSLEEAFPENPESFNSSRTADLRASLERVLKTRQLDNMKIQRYYIQNYQTGAFEERHWSPTNVPIFSRDGTLRYISNRVVDVTEFNLFHEGEPNSLYNFQGEREAYLQAQQLKVANDYLQESEASLQNLFENSLDAVIGMDERGMIINWNSQAEKTFGWSKEDSLGKKLSDLIIPVKHRANHERGLTHFLNTGIGPALNKRLELTAITKDDREIPVELSITSVKSKGHFIFYGVLRDISDRVRYIEALKIAKDAAESANYAKSAFLANMSHELRTPLGAVLGFSELLTESKISAEEKTRFVKSIRRNGELLSNLINDILDLSKVEADKLVVEQRKTLIPDVITDLESFLAVKASEKGLSYNVHCEVGVPRAITTDPLRLRQILLNIVGNAIKFTAKGKIEVNIRLAPQSNSTQLLSFTISDTGIGIDQAEAKELFQPFTQADPSMKRRFGGVGLGLIISRKLAALLGGDVKLKTSDKGHGSTFEVTIDPGPIEKIVDVPKYMPPKIKSSAAKESVKRSASTELPLLQGINILLVDDSLDNQILVTHLLKLSGATVETAENGKVATEKARAKDYDIILMDLQMPIMDGYEATQKLRSEGFLTPIIALTAHASEKDREYCLENGFNDHISKPVHRKALVNGIATICGRSLTDMKLN